MNRGIDLPCGHHFQISIGMCIMRLLCAACGPEMNSDASLRRRDAWIVELLLQRM
jgi:hypothetical protein